MTGTDVALELFVAWLNTEHGRHLALQPAADGDALATDGALRLAIEGRTLLAPTENDGWLAVRSQLQELIADDLPVSIAVWVPAGADLPGGEPAASEFVSLVREAAVKLGPSERAFVSLPVSVFLRKNADSGGVISATGAMNPYWARFTEKVQGTYDLDASRLHRLPESEEHLEQLMAAIIERAGRLETGQFAEIETFDAWTVQRLAGDGGVTIVGVPPAEAQDMGLAVRRNFRRILAESGPSLRELDADMRALVVVGHYARMEQEGATTAMRGYDPSLYSGLDFVCLAADGLVKPLVQMPAALLPWSGTGK